MTTAVAKGLAAARHVLDNGTVVISKSAHTVPAITFHVGVNAGSIYDSNELVGLSHLASRVLDRGTRQKTTEQIAEALDERGVSLSVSANRHVMTVSCTCLADDFEAMLALAGEIAMQPAFPEQEIEKRKGEVLNAIRQDTDNPAAMAMQTFFAMLYPDSHPYGRPSKGTVESVSRIERQDLVAFHEARFAPSATTVVIVGDVDRERAVAAGERVFGTWRKSPPPEASLAHPPHDRSRELRVIPMMNKVQADIAYGFTTIVRSDPSYYAFTLMNNALGQYGIGGRLGDSIRERQGMAYYVFSSFDANVVEGPLVVRAGVNPANVDRAIASIDEEMRRMADEGMTAAELADCKQYLIGSIPRLLETNGAIATFLHTAEFFGLGLDHDLRLPSLLESVTLEDVNAAARRALDVNRAAVVVAGPYQR
ncbi:MAG TPA: pitrilysin family protein [Vicinamibacterales bacterium]|nr:pitrilysin family protein [Vicinamibacterales bacterium]